MAIETKEQVAQYLVLAGKNETELKAICEGLKLETHGTKEDLLDRLTETHTPSYQDVLLPQLIPLRTRLEDGTELPEATRVLLYWRKLIYETRKEKEFKAADSFGKVQAMKMRYLLCPEKTLKSILEKKWFDPRFAGYGDVLNQLRINPQLFSTHIVQKLNKGKRWIMIHCCVKDQDAVRKCA